MYATSGLSCTVTGMTNSAMLERDAANVHAAFDRVFHETFEGDLNVVNPNLEIEVIAAGTVTGVYGEQSALIAITPWGTSGIVLPGRGLPESMVIAGVRRPVMLLEDVPETGPYAQVVLVPDVSKYTNQAQARTIAQSMIPVLLDGIAPQQAPAE